MSLNNTLLVDLCDLFRHTIQGSQALEQLSRIRGHEWLYFLRLKVISHIQSAFPDKLPTTLKKQIRIKRRNYQSRNFCQLIETTFNDHMASIFFLLNMSIIWFRLENNILHPFFPKWWFGVPSECNLFLFWLPRVTNSMIRTVLCSIS